MISLSLLLALCARERFWVAIDLQCGWLNWRGRVACVACVVHGQVARLEAAVAETEAIADRERDEADAAEASFLARSPGQNDNDEQSETVPLMDQAVGGSEETVLHLNARSPNHVQGPVRPGTPPGSPRFEAIQRGAV